MVSRKGGDQGDPRGHISNTGHTKPSSRSGPLLPSPRTPSLHTPVPQPLLLLPLAAGQGTIGPQQVWSGCRQQVAMRKQKVPVPDGEYSACRTVPTIRMQDSENSLIDKEIPKL